MARTALASCVVLGLLTVPACGARQARIADRVASRATFDLGCPVNGSQVQVVGSFTWGVDACGCRATYIERGDTFLLNAASGTCGAVATAGGAR